MSRFEELSSRRLVQAIPVDPDSVGLLLGDARAHLHTARAALAGGDLAGAYQLLYGAARKAVTAALAAEGWRVRGPGAHANLIILAQERYGDLPGGQVLEQLDRIRQVRNEAEYEGHHFVPDEVIEDLGHAEATVAMVEAHVVPPLGEGQP